MTKDFYQSIGKYSRAVSILVGIILITSMAFANCATSGKGAGEPKLLYHMFSFWLCG
jgi:hypothetical protein